MKKILITCVNYNTYDYLIRFIDSIENSLLHCNIQNLQVEIHIADHSTQKQKVDFSKYKDINIILYPLDNLGYLGGAATIINHIDDITQYDFVAISNVDLALYKCFFSSLLEQKLPDETGWIAPSIYSKLEKRDKNPKILNRYSLKRIKMLQIMYKYPIVNKIYLATLYKRKKIQATIPAGKTIYAGHGSFILLTKKFFSNYRQLKYPIFLFGEEIYFAELMQKQNLKVLYIPSIKIWDIEHTSTGSIKKRAYYRYNHEAITYIRKTFYE